MSVPEKEFGQRPSKIEEKLQDLQEQLALILGVTKEEFSRSQRFVSLIAEKDRREVWNQLSQAGLDLPELQLSGGVFMTAALLVLVPVVLLSFQFHWSLAFCLVELRALAHKMTRPWATNPACACETPYEAALHLTPFALGDYRAGLWSKEEIRAKVRSIISRHLNLPFDSINDATPLPALCDC